MWTRTTADRGRRARHLWDVAADPPRFFTEPLPGAGTGQAVTHRATTVVPDLPGHGQSEGGQPDAQRDRAAGPIFTANGVTANIAAAA
jgi:hypothetical protein